MARVRSRLRRQAGPRISRRRHGQARQRVHGLRLPHVRDASHLAEAGAKALPTLRRGVQLCRIATREIRSTTLDWKKVVAALRDDAEAIRMRAIAGFPNDIATQQEMRTRAALLVSFADALEAGIDK